MATERAVQVMDTAVDTAGISVVSATQTLAIPRRGSIYNPDTFAAAAPVWFHPMHDGRYLGLFSRYWNAATAAYNSGPQIYSAHTEVTDPSWAYIDPGTGATTGPSPIPSNSAGTRVLTAACSRGDYLFTLGTLDGNAWVQHFVFTRNGGLQLQGEEQVPVNYTLGVYADGSHLWVFGAGTGGHLSLVRKNWGRIGISKDVSQQWQYRSASGWLTDPATSEPLLDTSGGFLPADGPCSMAVVRDRLVLSTTTHAAAAWSSTSYTKRQVDSRWKLRPVAPIDLGTDSTYLGGGACLQAQLPANSATLTGTQAGFTYVKSTKLVVSANTGILTEWGMLAL